MTTKPSAQVIYTIVRQADWLTAEQAGRYEGSNDDAADGFLHFSTADQVVESARRHRAGEPDLLLVSVSTADLGPALRWEWSAGRNDHFPHLYEPLNLTHVVDVWPLPLDPDGGHRFPDGFPANRV